MGRPIIFKLVDMQVEQEHLVFKFLQLLLTVVLMFWHAITTNVQIQTMARA